MTKCKYWDAGFCYAPDDVETSASSQSACYDPDYCPYLKSQMTKQTLPDTIEIGGVKYQRVEEPEQLKTLYQMVSDNSKYKTSYEICDIVKKWMSQYTHNVMSGEYLRGYKDCMLVLEENLK